MVWSICCCRKEYGDTEYKVIFMNWFEIRFMELSIVSMFRLSNSTHTLTQNKSAIFFAFHWIWVEHIFSSLIANGFVWMPAEYLTTYINDQDCVQRQQQQMYWKSESSSDKKMISSRSHNTLWFFAPPQFIDIMAKRTHIYGSASVFVCMINLPAVSSSTGLESNRININFRACVRENRDCQLVCQSI